MKKFFNIFLYFFGLITITGVTLYLNSNTPPNFDEAHAWNIARFLSPLEIFTISKTEGHPFLWYYLLMPLAKTNFLYPYSLYFLNYIIIITALFILYKSAPFPTYLKYLITLSAPFSRLYSCFARSYSLSILLLFILLYLYKERNKKLKTYLLFILLLTNTNALGFITAVPFCCLILYENMHIFLQNKKITPILIIFNAALLEILLLIAQFYGYDTDIPQHTPRFKTLTEDINKAFSPLNIPLFCILSITSIGIFLKKHCYYAVFFQIMTNTGLIILFNFIHLGATHHYFYFYIILLVSFWLAGIEKELPNLSYLPLSIISFALIFNFNIHYKIADKNYLTNLHDSAIGINRIFSHDHATIYTFSHMDGEIISPYLSPNITLINQTMTNSKDLKAFQEILYPLYVEINPNHIIQKLSHTPDILIYRNCGEEQYQNPHFIFNLKYRLNNSHCLYDIILNK